MVSVVETKAASRTLELLGGDALEGSLSSHGHEDGEVDGSMGKSQDGSASPCCLGPTRVLTLVTDIHCGLAIATASRWVRSRIQIPLIRTGLISSRMETSFPGFGFQNNRRTSTYGAFGDQLKSERSRGSLV